VEPASITRIGGLAVLAAQLRKSDFRARDLRGSIRRPCNHGAILRWREFDETCIVENISAGGCGVRIASDKLIRLDSVLVDIPPLHLLLDGIVVWRRGAEAGIRFGYTLPSRICR
jgi:hypothetical protein